MIMTISEPGEAKLNRPLAQKELEFWLVRSGALPESYLPASRIGFYADFT